MAEGTAGQDNPNHAQELEIKLRETIERYELIFSATNDVLYELNLETGVVIWNEALYTQFGYERCEEVKTLDWWTNHIHEDDALRLEKEISEWFEGSKNAWQAEYRFLKADGMYADVRDRGAVIREPDGTPIRIIGSFLDITKQKQLDRAQDEFISLASHQLRTPLTAIRIYSEMLASGLTGPLSDTQKNHIDRITDASVRMIKLVGDILNASRIELGQVDVHPVPTDMGKFLRAQIKELRPIANAKGVKVRRHIDSNAKEADVDRNILELIVNNFLTNAIRYANSQKGIVKVSFTPNEEGYLLSVKDNGIGIPKGDQPYIFYRFYRGHNNANIKEHGTGLGLHTVKQMAEAAGYKLSFVSVKGEGATFSLQIPAYVSRNQLTAKA